MGKLTSEQEQEINELYNQGKGLTPTRISKQLNISYSAVYTRTKLKKEDFTTTSYLNSLAKKRGDKNHHEYHKRLLKEKYNQTPYQRKEFLAKQAGFKSKKQRD